MLLSPRTLAVVLVACAFTTQANELDLGSSIFNRGIGRDNREISARVHGQTVLRGESVACKNCHGTDASGGGEAFVRAPDIRWLTLTKQYSARQTGGSRPAYNFTSFTSAIREGYNSSNTVLDLAMPRFELADDEISAIAEYLKTVGKSTTELGSLPVILSILPQNHNSVLAQKVASGLYSCNSHISGERHSSLEILRYKTPADAIKKLEQRLKSGKVAYIVAPFITGWEHDYFAITRKYRIQTLLPITPVDLPYSDLIRARIPGIQEQIEAIARAIETNSINILNTRDSDQNWLHQIVIEVAGRRGKIIATTADTSGTTNSWIVIAPLNSIQPMPDRLSVTRPQRIFVPASMFDPATAIAWSKSSALSWIIAYPFDPQATDARNWNSFADTITTAACIIMRKTTNQHELRTMLSIDKFIYFNPDLTDASTSSQEMSAFKVTLKEWQADPNQNR